MLGVCIVETKRYILLYMVKFVGYLQAFDTKIYGVNNFTGLFIFLSNHYVAKSLKFLY
jgi:hypothetical protein